MLEYGEEKGEKNASRHLEKFCYLPIELEKFTINPLWISEAKFCYPSLTFVTCNLIKIAFSHTIACMMHL